MFYIVIVNIAKVIKILINENDELSSMCVHEHKKISHYTFKNYTLQIYKLETA